VNFSPIYSFLCSSLHLSLRLSVFVFVFEYFPLCSLRLSKSCSYQTSKRLKHTHTHTHIYIYIYIYIYICFKEDDDRIYARTHTRLLESPKPLYTPSKIIQKALRSLIFFTLYFIEFGRWTNTLGPRESGCFYMLCVWKMFVETEVIYKWSP